MRFAIRGYEDTFGGMHGIENVTIQDLPDYDTAQMYGEELGEQVIEDYSHMFEDDNGPSPMYDIYYIKEDVEEDCDTLEDIAWDMGWDDFVKEYCEEGDW